MPSTIRLVVQPRARSLLALLLLAPLALALPSLRPGSEAAARPGTASRTDFAPSDAVGDTARIVAEIRDVREGATAREWIAEHPSDVVEEFDAPSRDHDTDGWCVRARHLGKLADGSTWERTAYFFEPTPPPDLALPAAGKQLQGECRLGLVWIEAPASARAAMSAAMTAAFGRATPPDPLASGTRAGDRRGEEAWPSERAHGLLASEEDRADESPSRARRARLRLALPAWDRWDERIVDAPAAVDPLATELVAGETERTRIEQELAVLAVSVRAIPGVEERSRSAMLALLADHDFSSQRPDLTTPDIVAILASWTKSARALPPEARVDALLAADRLVDFVNRNGWAPDPEEGHDTLRVGGALFVHHPLAAGYVYAHSMLEEALELEAPAAAHDRALVRAMEIGFDNSGMCDAGEFPFEYVIATGEPLIARSRDARTRSATHFLVGDAYATIVALARGAGGEYAHPAPHQAREEDARAKALAHYRAALALDPSSETARRTWRTAWRLAAGLSPVWPRYYCVVG